jgi:hypothetical protein
VPAPGLVSQVRYRRSLRLNRWKADDLDGLGDYGSSDTLAFIPLVYCRSWILNLKLFMLKSGNRDYSKSMSTMRSCVIYFSRDGVVQDSSTPYPRRRPALLMPMPVQMQMLKRLLERHATEPYSCLPHTHPSAAATSVQIRHKSPPHPPISNTSHTESRYDPSHPCQTRSQPVPSDASPSLCQPQPSLSIVQIQPEQVYWR